jgi:virginiamycin B lyase
MYGPRAMPCRIIGIYGTIVKGTIGNSKTEAMRVPEQGGVGVSMLSEPSPPRQSHSGGAHLPPTKVFAQATGCRGVARWSIARQRSTSLFLLLLLLGTVVVVLLSLIDVSLQPSAGQARTPLHARPLLISKIPATLAPAPSVTQRLGSPRLYRLPPNVGLMQPSVDQEGHIWVGEMTANRLARVDSQTRSVTTWQPPDAQSGIMTTTVDSHGQVWFVDQNAQYIGRFDPVRQTFRLFPLLPVHGRQLGPQAIQFDARGQLWFTAPSGGQIGCLNPATGAITLWAVPDSAANVPSIPFSLAVTPASQVWFGMLTGGMVGRLDPATGQMTLYHLSDPQANVFSMTSDARGRIWFTELNAGKLGWIDPVTDYVTELLIPGTLGQPIGLYGVVVTTHGDIWVVCNGINALLRYEPASNTLTFFRMTDASSAPYGLARDEASRLWFTSSNTIGELIP